MLVQQPTLPDSCIFNAGGSVQPLLATKHLSPSLCKLWILMPVNETRRSETHSAFYPSSFPALSLPPLRFSLFLASLCPSFISPIHLWKLQQLLLMRTTDNNPERTTCLGRGWGLGCIVQTPKQFLAKTCKNNKKMNNPEKFKKQMRTWSTRLRLSTGPDEKCRGKKTSTCDGVWLCPVYSYLWIIKRIQSFKGHR